MCCVGDEASETDGGCEGHVPACGADWDRLTEDGETDGTDKADVDDVFVAEAGRAKVDFVLGGDGEDGTGGGWGQKGHLCCVGECVRARVQ